MSYNDTVVNNIVGHVNIKCAVTAEIVDDILSAAWDTPFLSWCVEVHPVGMHFPEGADYTSQCLARGANVVVVGYDEADDIQNYILTLDKLLSGISIYCHKHQRTVDYIADEVDAEIADCIVQYALFGDLVFG